MASNDKSNRIDLRLYNTIIVYDVYVVARSAEAAREAILAAIDSGDAKATELVSKEITADRSIRSSWVDQPPYIAADITDEEFTALKGSTTLAAFERLYKRRS